MTCPAWWGFDDSQVQPVDAAAADHDQVAGREPRRDRGWNCCSTGLAGTAGAGQDHGAAVDSSLRGCPLGTRNS